MWDEFKKNAVVVATIGRAQGVQGWVRVYSHTKPMENLLEYSPWVLRQNNQYREIKLIKSKPYKDGFIVLFDGIHDRDQAKLLTNGEILVSRDQFAQPEEGEYYWSDIIGLAVEDVSGKRLGTIKSIFETGANDVLLIEAAEKGQQAFCVPLIMNDVIKKVDLDNKLITVDWEPIHAV